MPMLYAATAIFSTAWRTPTLDLESSDPSMVSEELSNKASRTLVAELKS